MNVRKFLDLLVSNINKSLENSIQVRKNYDFNFNIIANSIRYYDAKLKNDGISYDTYETLSNVFSDRLGFSYDNYISGKYQFYLAQMFICYITIFNRSGYPYSYIKYKKEISVETERKAIIQKFIISINKNRLDIAGSCIMRLMELDDINEKYFMWILNIIYEWELKSVVKQ